MSYFRIPGNEDIFAGLGDPSGTGLLVRTFIGATTIGAAIALLYLLIAVA